MTLDVENRVGSIDMLSVGCEDSDVSGALVGCVGVLFQRLVKAIQKQASANSNKKQLYPKG